MPGGGPKYAIAPDRAQTEDTTAPLQDFQLLGISVFENPNGIFIVDGGRLKGFVGEAVRGGFEVKNSREGIGDFDRVFQEGEGVAGGVALYPQGQATQFYGEGVFVHAVEAVGDGVSDALSEGFGGGVFFAGANPGQGPAEPPCRRQQKMP